MSISDKAFLQNVGDRIARYRLNKNITQAELAEEAGVSRATIARIERGSSTQLTNFIRVLRALDLIDQFDAMLPAPPASPLQQIKMHGKLRQRASSSDQNHIAEPTGTWEWADEDKT